jgi:hypothetical protein
MFLILFIFSTINAQSKTIQSYKTQWAKWTSNWKLNTKEKNKGYPSL